MRLYSRLFWLALWGISFAYIESSVVVYLRKIYYPQGFSFPLVPIESHILSTETIREAMTLIIMWATVTLTFERLQSKIAAYLILFGVWDIFYYIFLKLLLDWPASVTTWDILFLIPSPWVGPVWAPVVVSMALIFAGVVLLKRAEEKRFLRFGLKFFIGELLAGALIILSFLIPGADVLKEGVPSHFPASIFWSGFSLGTAIFLYTVFGDDLFHKQKATT
ncbi:hypothetical protein [Hydrogenimonas cancrithermarum]|uniref:Uncharacterized protein n=1 Tax=Hydrogenimonas cancrithermarum TaxID=2993563 RepID=A0ABM8FHV8_9BACT|nr:hypothetical protein [Hydrogenimonas cancrithermarum]BDY11852.1 hypothetical protein HCR_01640 [Hydrogenimonas cancrithermarum]